MRRAGGISLHRIVSGDVRSVVELELFMGMCCLHMVSDRTSTNQHRLASERAV